jgi:beta-glucosidase
MAPGYTQRSGLVDVDVATQRRIPKATAQCYADLIAAGRNNLVPAESGTLIGR